MKIRHKIRLATSLTWFVCFAMTFGCVQFAYADGPSCNSTIRTCAYTEANPSYSGKCAAFMDFKHYKMTCTHSCTWKEAVGTCQPGCMLFDLFPDSCKEHAPSNFWYVNIIYTSKTACEADIANQCNHSNEPHPIDCYGQSTFDVGCIPFFASSSGSGSNNSGGNF